MYKVCVQDLCQLWIQVLATVESPNLERSTQLTRIKTGAQKGTGGSLRSGVVHAPRYITED